MRARRGETKTAGKKSSGRGCPEIHSEQAQHEKNTVLESIRRTSAQKPRAYAANARVKNYPEGQCVRKLDEMLDPTDQGADRAPTTRFSGTGMLHTKDHSPSCRAGTGRTLRCRPFDLSIRGRPGLPSVAGEDVASAAVGDGWRDVMSDWSVGSWHDVVAGRLFVWFSIAPRARASSLDPDCSSDRTIFFSGLVECCSRASRLVRGDGEKGSRVVLMTRLVNLGLAEQLQANALDSDGETPGMRRLLAKSPVTSAP